MPRAPDPALAPSPKMSILGAQGLMWDRSGGDGVSFPPQTGHLGRFLQALAVNERKTGRLRL